MKPCPYCGAQYPDDAEICSVDGHKLGAPPNAQPELTLSPAANGGCPACRANDYARAVDLKGSLLVNLYLLNV